MHPDLYAWLHAMTALLLHLLSQLAPAHPQPHHRLLLRPQAPLLQRELLPASCVARRLPIHQQPPAQREVG